MENIINKTIRYIIPEKINGWSLLRIICWTILFSVSITLISKTKDYAKNSYTMDPNIISVPFYPIDQTALDEKNNDLKIAWLGGSTTRIKANNNFLGDDVVAYINNNSDVKCQLYPYYISGMRISELFLSVQHAIKRNPDLIVFPINPIFTLNQKSPFLRSKLFAHSIDYKAFPANDWTLIGSLLEPRHFGSSLLYESIPAYQHRYDWNKGLNSLTTQFYNIKSNPGKKDTINLSMARFARNPLLFWTLNEKLDGQWYKNYRELHLKYMEYTTTDKDTLTVNILLSLLENLHEKGIPTYIYHAPIDLNAMPEKDKEKIIQIENFLEDLKQKYANSNIHISPTNVNKNITTLNFTEDLIHLKDAHKMPEYFNDKILPLLQHKSGNEK